MEGKNSQHDQAEHRQTGSPPEREEQAQAASLWGREQQAHCDDWQRADRDSYTQPRDSADRRRQQVRCHVLTAALADGT
jgi:hypothetical protein